MTFICKFCELEKQSKNALGNHETRCKKNPERRIQCGGGSKVAWNKGLTKEIDKRVAHTEITKEKISQLNKTRKVEYSPEFREKQRQNALRRNLGGVRQSKRIEYNGKTLGSSYEVTVAKSLDENNITWDICKRFKYIDTFGKQRTYTPDFYLFEYDVYLDPKNDFLIEKINPALGFNDLEKIKLVEKQNNIRIIVLNNKQLEWKTIKNLI